MRRLIPIWFDYNETHLINIKRKAFHIKAMATCHPLSYPSHLITSARVSLGGRPPFGGETERSYWAKVKSKVALLSSQTESASL